MGILVDDRRVTAAAKSMDQFYPTVRALFGTPVDNVVVEATTIFLYARTAQRVFGRRFVERMDGLLPHQLKYSTPPEVRERVARLTDTAEAFERGADELLSSRSASATEYEHHIRSLIKGVFAEAGLALDEAERIRDAFVPMEAVLERIREHLLGIKHQNSFLL